LLRYANGALCFFVFKQVIVTCSAAHRTILTLTLYEPSRALTAQFNSLSVLLHDALVALSVKHSLLALIALQLALLLPSHHILIGLFLANHHVYNWIRLLTSAALGFEFLIPVDLVNKCTVRAPPLVLCQLNVRSIRLAWSLSIFLAHSTQVTVNLSRVIIATLAIPLVLGRAALVVGRHFRLGLGFDDVLRNRNGKLLQCTECARLSFHGVLALAAYLLLLG
jgi:hypothetical protein